MGTSNVARVEEGAREGVQVIGERRAVACLAECEEASMRRHLLITVGAVAITAGAMIALPSVSAALAPPMGGGYTNVIPIPVDDPSVKAIAGALFKPEGAGPFPAVVYMSGCAGLSIPPEVLQEKVVIDRLTSKGIATLIVDPFTPRGEMEGVCAKLGAETFEYFSR